MGDPRSFEHGTAAQIISQLKRDRPDVAERLAAGEFRSARAAAIEAVHHLGPNLYRSSVLEAECVTPA